MELTLHGLEKSKLLPISLNEKLRLRLICELSFAKRLFPYSFFRVFISMEL